MKKRVLGASLVAILVASVALGTADPARAIVSPRPAAATIRARLLRDLYVGKTRLPKNMVITLSARNRSCSLVRGAGIWISRSYVQLYGSCWVLPATR